MFENPSARGRGKPAVFQRQSSRQGLMLRSHQYPMGKWHLKSLLIAMLILVVFLYYVHNMDEQSGVQAKKRDLVVRPAKPYKSPSRRRHSKPHKDVIIVQPLVKPHKDVQGVQPLVKPHKDVQGVQSLVRPHKDVIIVQPLVKSAANNSTIPNNPIVDLKHNQSQVGPAQHPKPTEIRPVPNKFLQYKSKYKKLHKSKTHQRLPPYYQVSPFKNQHLPTFKDSSVKGNKKPLPNISPGKANILPDSKTTQQTGYKMHSSKNGVVLQSTKSPTGLKYLKNNNGDLHILKPLFQAEVHEDATHKPAISSHNKNYVLPRPAVVPKPVMKMKRSFTG